MTLLPMWVGFFEAKSISTKLELGRGRAGGGEPGNPKMVGTDVSTPNLQISTQISKF